MARRRVALGAGVALLALLLADQAADRLLLADGQFLGRPVAPFDPPLFSPSQRQVLAQIERDPAAIQAGKFDPELGWCNRPGSGFGEQTYDELGARIGLAPLARAKPAGVRRALALGCSMTHGDEVGAGEAWCAQVDAALPALEVANLGVPAFGIDQALLRLRRDGPALAPDEVWLGILPQAALRVTTRYRPLLDHWSLDVAFKPAFELAPDGALVLLPDPVRSPADILRLLTDQQLFLDALGNDPWIRHAPAAFAPRGSSWMQHSFATRLWLTLREAGGRDLAPCFDDESDFGRLFTALTRATAAEAAELGARFRILVLPGADDLVERASVGRGYWEDWAARRAAEGLSVFDASSALVDSGVELGQLFAPHGHYNARASALVARALAAELER